jgi:hypothetical protein
VLVMASTSDIERDCIMPGPRPRLTASPGPDRTWSHPRASPARR